MWFVKFVCEIWAKVVELQSNTMVQRFKLPKSPPNSAPTFQEAVLAALNTHWTHTIWVAIIYALITHMLQKWVVQKWHRRFA